MTCNLVKRRLSEWIDGELEPAAAQRVQAHVASCADCGRRADELRALGGLLAELPRLECPEAMAARVFDRVEMETRRPALAALFRSSWANRPFIVPSFLPATAVLVAVLAGVLALDSGPMPEVHLVPGAWRATPALGTESNPVFPSAEIDMPREATAVENPEAVLSGREGTVFLETVVARDGSVADVTVLNGDAHAEVALVDALRRQRFQPTRYRGRPVAVQVYRLISRMEVRSPLT
jgi:hypothetical protein